MKKQGNQSANEINHHSKGAKKDATENAENSKQGDDELDQIGGGKEAEIEQYSQMLHKITEESLIQTGILGKFLPPLI